MRDKSWNKKMARRGEVAQTIDNDRYAEFNYTKFVIYRREAVVNLVPITRRFEYSNQKAIDGTIYDPRLGYSTYNTGGCATCKETKEMCQGHRGAIILPANMQIPHPGYTKEIGRLLNIFCQHCFQPLLEKYEVERFMRLDIERRLDAIYEFIKQHLNDKTLLCQNSECKDKNNSLIEFDKRGFYYYQEYKEKKKQRAMDGSILSPLQVFNFLSAISNNTEVTALLGFTGENRPVDLLLGYLIVPPPCVRESNMNAEGGARSNMDYIGQVYQDILTKIFDFQNLPERSTERLTKTNDLFIYFSHLINNSDGLIKKGRAPLRGITQLLKSKKGYLRGNAMGKRTDFSARSVITPNPTIAIGYIGCPGKIAKNQTVPEFMCRYNIDYYRRLLAAQNAGAPKEITRRALSSNIGALFQINDNNKKEILAKLAHGDMITRHLINDDWFFVNRNPSLHKESNMSNQVYIVSESTLQLPPAIVTPYNADFDGDEMNLYIPQDYRARAEARYISPLPKLIENPETGANMFGAVMDNITMTFNLTNLFVAETVTISKEVFERAESLLKWKHDLSTLDRRLAVHRVNKYSNRGLFSMLLPATFNYEVSIDGTRTRVIQDGVFLQGTLKKEHVGRSKRSIIKFIDFLYGWKRASLFVNDLSAVISYWATTQQLSVGPYDCRIDDPQLEEIKTRDNSLVKFTVMTLQTEVESYLEQERLEGEINVVLNRTAELGKKIDQLLPASNPIKQMINSGAKGDFFNLAQIMVQVGQQFLEGRRIPLALADGTRSSIFFPLNSRDPEARGLVVLSFSDGLTVSMIVFHLIATREGLVDTATKTADVGDLHHRMAKALENCMVEYDGTVCDRSGNIIQFYYGDDGLDPAQKMFYGSGENEFGFFADLELLAEEVNSECFLEEDLD